MSQRLVPYAGQVESRSGWNFRRENRVPPVASVVPALPNPAPEPPAKRKSPQPVTNRNSRSYRGRIEYGQKRGWTLREIAEHYRLDHERLLVEVRNMLMREP